MLKISQVYKGVLLDTGILREITESSWNDHLPLILSSNGLQIMRTLAGLLKQYV